MALTIWPSLRGVPTNAPITTAISGQIVMTELGAASPHTVVLPAADGRAIAAMAPFTLLEIEQDGLGTVAFGYVLNPKQQITDNGDGTITLELQPLVTETMNRLTGRGWVADNNISIVCEELGGLVAGWTGVFTDRFNLDESGRPRDIAISVNLNGPTIWAGWLQVAQQFAQFARQGVDANGVPTRTLEMGQFGAAPTMWLTSADGADADGAAGNGLIRLVATVDRQPNDVSNLVNVCTPFGGGSSSDTLVTLERLWRILNDPDYPEYGKYGAQPGSVFPEYDPAAYPISDPENPPDGKTHYIFADGNVVTPSASLTLAQIKAAGGVLYQGALGTRKATRDGHWDYCMYDAASYAAYGFHEGPLLDSALVYADSSPANQELTQRALYGEMVGIFKRFAHPHHTFACTAPGTGRPTRAGDLVSVDYQQIGGDAEGRAVVGMDVTEDLRVMGVVRSFQGDDVPVDTYTLSNLGRFDQDDAAVQAGQAATITALQRQQGTGLAKDSVVIRDNIDAANPLTHWLYIPAEHFRYHTVRVRCDFLPFRGTATTATNIAGTPVISADVEVSLATPADINLGGTFNADGTGATGTTDGFSTDLYVHVYGVGATGATTGTGNYPESGGKPAFGRGGGAASLDIPVYRNTSANNAGLDTNTTKSTFTAPINKTVAKAKDIIAHITAGQRIANLPGHVHDVEKRIPTGQPSPVSITLAIGGQALSSGARATGTRDASGAFFGSFIVEDISAYLDAFPAGTDVPITFSAGTNASNPFGVGFVSITLTSTEELGGLTSTVNAA